MSVNQDILISVQLRNNTVGLVSGHGPVNDIKQAVDLSLKIKITFRIILNRIGGAEYLPCNPCDLRFFVTGHHEY